jgi:DNA-binding MarR family transcriptional regulator
MLTLIPKLHRASHAIAVLMAGSPELALNQAEAHVLASLWPTGSSTINELHVTFGHRRSTLTSVLDRLERRGLIKRSVSELDRRSVRVTLSGRAQRRRERNKLSLPVAEPFGATRAAMQPF